MTPDIQHAENFLTQLAGSGAKFAFATFDDRGDDRRLAHRLYGNLQSAVRLTGTKAGKHARTGDFLAYLQTLGAGVFVAINESDGQGARAENITAIRALVADADSLDQLSGVRRFVASTGLRPSMAVESGGLAAMPDGSVIPKMQFYWRIDGCAPAQFAEAQAMLNSRTGADPAVKDLPRVLRLPGFWHQKREPRMTRVTDSGCRRYGFLDFMSRVHAAPQAAPLSSAAGSSSRGGTPGGSASPATRDRWRELLAAHEGRLKPAVAAFLAEARGPGDDGGGNRHNSLLTATGALIVFGWNDLAIHAAVTVEADRLWGGASRREVVQRMLDFARGRECARLGTMKTARWGAR